MPPEEAGEALKPAQVAVIRKWIEQGRPRRRTRSPSSTRANIGRSSAGAACCAQGAERGAGSRIPIDAFHRREHDRHGLMPQSAAEKSILLRRVYLDLIGLPPTREELHAFLSDTAPDAYEKVVDRLLASPQYGERWGRHWMDVWRYSDW